MGKAADRAQKRIDGLGKKRAKVRLDANDSSLIRKIRQAESRARKLGNTKASVVLTAADKATSVIGKVTTAAKRFAGTAYSALLKIKDSGAFQALGKLKSGLHSLTSKAWTAVVKIKDLATAPLRALKNHLFSVKTLIAGIVGGVAAQKFVVSPVQQYADYEDLVTQFGVLLGSQDAAKQRLSSLVSFAGQTPFTRDEIFQASRVLQTYTSGALATPDSVGGLRMIGDIAAATGQEYTRVATYMGRLYNEVGRGGEALGEPLMLLREIGALSADSEERIKKIASGSGDISSKWAQIADEFSATNGMMAAMSNQTNNLLLGVKSFLRNNLWMKMGEGISEQLKPLLIDFRKWRSDNADLIAGWADSVKQFASLVSGKALDVVRGLAKRADALFRSDAFKNASLGGKMKLVWDTLVIDPISDWWNNGGQAKTAAAANRIGGAIGGMLSGGILALLGSTSLLDGVDATGAGASVAASFVQGFKENFDGAAIKTAVLDVFNSLWETFKGASLGGKFAMATVGALIGNKLFGPLLKGGWTLLKGGGKLGKLLFGGLFGGKESLAQTVGTMRITAGVVYVSGPVAGNGPTVSPGGSGPGGGNWWPTTFSLPRLFGMGGDTPLALPGGSAGGGLFARVGNFLSKAGPIGAGIFAAMTALRGGQEFYRGRKLVNEGDVLHGNTMQAKGASKWGAIAAGAGIGALGGPAGMLLGAGAGALGSWLLGPLFDKSEKLAEHAKQTHNAVKGTVGEAKSLGRAFEESVLYDDPPIMRLGNALERLKHKARMGEYEGIYQEATILQRLKNAFSGPYKSPNKSRSFESTPTRKGGVTSVAQQVLLKTSYLVENQTDPVRKVMQAIPDTVRDAVRAIINVNPSVTGVAGIEARILSMIPNSVSKTVAVYVNARTNANGYASTALLRYRGGIVGGPSALQGFSDGGMVRGGSQLVRVAEEGNPEMIIPLSSQRRERALKLWEKTGRLLDVPGFAKGGLTDGRDMALRSYTSSRGNGDTWTTGGVDVGGVTIQGVNLTIHVDGSKDGVVEEIRAKRREIADEVCGVLAESLGAVFENTPARGGAA